MFPIIGEVVIRTNGGLVEVSAVSDTVVQSNNNSKIQVEEGSAVQVTVEKEEIKVTKVGTLEAIQQTLEDKATYIMLTADITDAPKADIVIDYECVFDGNGYTISSNNDSVLLIMIVQMIIE